MVRIYPELSEDQLSLLGSAAESQFYRACRSLSDDYLVIHSLPLIIRDARRGARDTEADFTIFHKKFGLLVVEVKGGGITFDARHNLWTSKNQDGQSFQIKDPYRQASTAKYAIVNEVVNHVSWKKRGAGRLQAGHAVFFPNLESVAAFTGPDRDPAITGCRTNLSKLDDWLERVFEFWAGEQNVGSPLGDEGLNLAHDILCHSISVRPLLGAQLEAEEQVRLQLTEQQTLVIRSLKRRNRAAVCGGAGTGKTLLAKYKAESLASEGKHVLMLCYNRALADHIQRSMTANDSWRVMSFHQYCSHKIREAHDKGRDVLAEARAAYPGEDDFDVQQPFALSLALESCPEAFDAVIVDEAQDFRGEYWLPVEMSLKDKDSILYVFYDGNQNIYRRPAEFPVPEDHTVYLTQNCRNTKLIHEAAYSFYAGERVDPPSILGRPPEFLVHPTLGGQAMKIASLVQQLITNERLLPDMIAVLIVEGRKDNFYNTLAQHPLPKPAKWAFEDHGVRQSVLVDTTRRFKGLEATYVILWGIDEETGAPKNDLLYVALSRAKGRLALVGSQTGCDGISSLIAPKTR